MSEEQLFKERRNLLVTSVALIVFMIAGGSIKQVSSLSGSVELTRPWVAEMFAWLIFAYFLWRYWIFIQNYKARYISEVNLSISKVLWYQELMKPHFFTLFGTESVSPDVLANIKRSLFKRGFLISHSAQTFPLPYFKMLFLDIKYFSLVAYRSSTFSDYILPLIISFIVLALGICKYLFKLI